MKVLITGSLGFIATNLILKLHNQKDYTLIGVDSGESKSNNKEYTENLCAHYLIDLAQKEELKKILKGVDLVIHLAAKGNVVDSIKNPIENFESNAKNTLNLLEAMRETGVTNIIFSSTGGALMGNTKPPVSEDSLPSPISPYGASKLACEGYLSAYGESYNFKSLILRFGNVYGPYCAHKSGVMNKWSEAFIRKEKIIIYGDGSSTRDYIYVEDLCHGLMQAIKLISEKNVESVEKFHLSNNSEVSLNDLYNAFSIASGYQVDITHLPARSGEVTRNFADTKKAKTVLGFSPTVNLISGVKLTFDWIKESCHNR